MSTPNNAEDLLRDALQARADRTTYEPTQAADVASRARFAQRRQNRGRALVAAAAVAAVAVPVGLFVADRPGSAPTPTPAGPVGEADIVRIDALGDLELGAPPAIGHVDDGTYVLPSGKRVELPVREDAPVTDAAQYLGGVLFTSQFQVLGEDPGPATLMTTATLVDLDGVERWSRCSHFNLAESPDRRATALAWFDGECGESWSAPHVELGPTEAGEPLASTDLDEDRKVRPVDASGDAVLYVVGDPFLDGERQRVELAHDGAPRTIPGLVSATAYDAGSGLVAGCAWGGNCMLVDAEDGTPRLVFPEPEQPVSFSPDGRLVVSTRGNIDEGLGLVVRDVASGEALVRLEGDRDAFMGRPPHWLTWEDSDHLLFTRVDSDGEALVRFGVDGSLELATPVRKPTLRGYVLPGT